MPFAAVLVHDDASQDAPAEELAVAAGQGRGQVLPAGHGRATAQLLDEVALGGGHGEGLPHRAAALGDERMDLGVRQVGADGTFGGDLAVSR